MASPLVPNIAFVHDYNRFWAPSQQQLSQTLITDISIKNFKKISSFCKININVMPYSNNDLHGESWHGREEETGKEAGKVVHPAIL